MPEKIIIGKEKAVEYANKLLEDEDLIVNIKKTKDMDDTYIVTATKGKQKKIRKQKLEKSFGEASQGIQDWSKNVLEGFNNY